jgi:hypothetical protein
MGGFIGILDNQVASMRSSSLWRVWSAAPESPEEAYARASSR